MFPLPDVCFFVYCHHQTSQANHPLPSAHVHSDSKESGYLFADVFMSSIKMIVVVYSKRCEKCRVGEAGEWEVVDPLEQENNDKSTESNSQWTKNIGKKLTHYKGCQCMR